MTASGLAKIADHVNDRARERSKLTHAEVESLRRAVLRSISIPKGTHHLRFKNNGGFAVIKDIGHGKHVLATILSRDMLPPGFEISRHVKSAGLSDAFRIFRRKATSAAANPHFYGEAAQVINRGTHELARDVANTGAYVMPTIANSATTVAGLLAAYKKHLRSAR